MKTGIQAILFDKDGTLLDFDATWTPAYRSAALFAAGSDTLADRLLSATGMDPVTGKSAAGSLLAAGNTREIAEAWIDLGCAHRLEQLTLQLDRIFISAMREAVPIAGVPEMLERLEKLGFGLGVASSDSEPSIRAFLEGAGLTARFSFVTGYDTGFGPKPEPGMVLGFAEAIALDPARIAVIGDNTHDLEMARAAGAGMAIGVLTGTSRKQDLEALSDTVLESAADLPDYLAHANR
ncbi:HAD family hydrolase [Roseibium aggregatum]|uniref:phosphoglycolate phosphatase n=1 Tax=Roseibium aggregatum TaxID=187304 RepID=A0A939J0Q4_9HYPH|nr:HAD family hydrolase [Roseibium aggregatum]MBN9671336.1 HAD family hydrolase [Roseibium aggregatum]